MQLPCGSGCTLPLLIDFSSGFKASLRAGLPARVPLLAQVRENRTKACHALATVAQTGPHGRAQVLYILVHKTCLPKPYAVPSAALGQNRAARGDPQHMANAFASFCPLIPKDERRLRSCDDTLGACDTCWRAWTCGP